MKKEVLQYLEDECGLKLCVHERDFLGGAAIAANICAAIEHSRRMVMVVSRYKNLSYSQRPRASSFSKNNLSESILFLLKKWSLTILKHSHFVLFIEGRSKLKLPFAEKKKA